MEDVATVRHRVRQGYDDSIHLNPLPLINTVGDQVFPVCS